jgi:hypothetical protein
MDNMDIWVEGFQSFKNLKSIKKGPTSEFEGDNLKLGKRQSLQNMKSP